MSFPPAAHYDYASHMLLIAVLVVGAIVIYSVWRRGSGSKRDDATGRLPSPRKVLPTWMGKIGGHMLLMKKSKLMGQIEDWAEAFGGSYEIFLFGTRRIVVTDPAESRRILSLRPSTFGRGSSPTAVNVGGTAVGMCPALFSDDGAAWARSRRLIAPAFSGQNVSLMVPAITKVVARLCDKWGAAADTGAVVDAKDDLGRVAHDVIALMAFRLDSNALAATSEAPSKTWINMSNLLEVYMKLILNPLTWFMWRYLPISGWIKQRKKEKADVDAILGKLIEKEKRLLRNVEEDSSKASSNVNHDSDASEGLLLRKLVGAGKNGSDSLRVKPLTDAEIVTNARGIFIAGSETTSLTLSWCVYYLATMPDVLSRCRKEALEVFSHTNGIATDFASTQSLTFIKAVLQETLRLRTAVPAITFFSKKNYTIAGRTYAPPVCFTVLLRYMATREENFTRPKDFIPARWIADEREEALLGPPKAGEENVPRKVNHSMDTFMVFGGGPRVCPGKDMARVEAIIALAAICARFDVSLAPGQADPPEEMHTVSQGPESMKVILTRTKEAQ